MNKDNLKAKASYGIIFLVFRRIIFQLIATLSNIFLARLLFPDDFGTYAIITFLFSLVFILSDIGFGPSIIQKKDNVTSQEKQTVLTTQFFMALFLYLSVYFLAPLVINFLQIPTKAVGLLRLYNLLLFISPFKSICAAPLERELEYRKVILVELGEEVIISLTSVCFALAGFGVSSFIYGVLLGRGIGALIYYLLLPFKLKFAFHLRDLSGLLKFGLPYQIYAGLNLINGPLIFLYLSKVVGSVNLGYFQFAQSLAVVSLAVPELFNRITFSTVSRLQEKKAALRGFIERVILITATFSFAITTILLVFGDKIIRFLYTDKWLASLPSFYMGVITSQILSFTSLMSVLLLGFGYSKTVRNMSVISAVITWGMAPLLINRFGFYGMNMVLLIVAFSAILLTIPVKKQISISFVKNILPAMISSLVTFLIAYNFRPAITSLTSLIGLVVISLGIYFSLTIIILRGRIVKEIILPVLEIIYYPGVIDKEIIDQYQTRTPRGPLKTR